MGAATADAALDPLQQFRSWASVLFALFGAVALIAGALVLPSLSAPQTYLVMVATGGGALIYLALALAIGRGDSWAIHAIVPACVLIICAGLLRAAFALTNSEISVPLEVLGAIAVLSRPHAPDVMPGLTRRGRRAVWLAVGGLVVCSLLPYAASPVTSAALFGAKQEDLALRLDLDCGGSSGAPITARATWAWTRDVPFAPPDDGLVVQWFATTGFGADPGTTVVGTRVSDLMTMAPGASTGAADALLGPIRTAGGQSVDVLVSRSGSELYPGWVEVDVDPNDVPPEALEFRAFYAHGDRWVQRSEPVFCS